MIISDLKKSKSGLYTVYIDQASYEVTEESVLKYRLFKGYEISEKELASCIASDDLVKIKRRAYLYSLKYVKNSYETLKYLTEREIPFSTAKAIVEDLRKEGSIDDLTLAKGFASSLARSSNGVYQIRYKLKNRHFDEATINLALEALSEEDIEEGKKKLYKKLEKKLENLNDFEKNRKTIEYFYRHGYDCF